MIDTDLDYFELAKELTRERAGTAADLDMPTELGIARQIVRSLVDRMVLMAERSHAALHYDNYVKTGPWTMCQESFCRDTAKLLRSIGATP